MEGRRKSLLFLLTVLGFLYVKYVRRYLKELARKKALLMKLPGLSIQRELAKKKKQWLIGAGFSMVPEGEELSRKNMLRYYFEYVPKVMYEMLDKDDGLYCSWAFNPDLPIVCAAVVIPKDIVLVRQLLSSKMLPNLVKSRSYTVIAKPLIGDGVLTSSGEAWAKQRSVLDHGFVPAILRKQVSGIEQTVEELTEKLTRYEEKDVDVLEEMLKTTLDVLGRVAFSYDIGGVTAETSKGAPLYYAFDSILSALVRRGKMVERFLARFKFLNRDFEHHMSVLENTVNGIIQKRLKEGLSTEEPRDLLDVMLKSELADVEGKKDNRIIVDNIKTLMFAGHDTTAALLTWMIYLLSVHPEVAEKIRTEFQEKHDGKVTLETIESAEYLNCCILEVLRMYPSAGFARETVQDIQLGKYQLPKGTTIVIFPYIVQRNPDYFERPHEFVPERWLRPNTEKLGFQARLAHETLKTPFLPFSLGKRNCVGRPLALLEVRIVITRLVQAFDILPPKVPHPKFLETPTLGMTLIPPGIRARFRRRK